MIYYLKFVHDRLKFIQFEKQIELIKEDIRLLDTYNDIILSIGTSPLELELNLNKFIDLTDAYYMYNNSHP